jgi:hypothetical protein
MKFKLIAAAVATLGSVSAFAAPLNPAVDAPAVVYYVAGASAQAQAFNAIAKSLFTTPADVIQITAAAPCGDVANANKHVAYFGKRNGVNTLLVYRNKDGSGAGVQQLLANSTSAAAITASTVISLPQAGATVAGAAGSYTSTSATCVARLPVAALSDVKHTELSASVLAVAGTAGYDALSAIKTPIKTGLQGFGVAVSLPLYNALVAANTAAGIPLVGTQAQPSIRKADYASLVNIAGSIKTAADLLNDPADAHTLEVARRVDVSGTQASSNLYFLAAKTAGAQLPATAADYPIADIAANGIAFSENSSTGNVTTKLNSTTAYVIGVISAENKPSATDTWKLVAIDGVSPNQAYDLATGTVDIDPNQRQNLATGSYDFAYESYLLFKDSTLNAGTGIVKAIADNIKLTGKSNLVGFAYIDAPGTWAPWDSSLGYVGNVNKQTRVTRGGNNLAPLGY